MHGYNLAWELHFCSRFDYLDFVEFMIFSDSVCYASTENNNNNKNPDQPLLTQVQDMLHETDVDQKEIVFMWTCWYLWK